MHARGWTVAVLLALALPAAAEPKPTPVDIKADKATAVVLADAAGGTYVVFPGKDPKLFYAASAKAKTLYAQIIAGRSRNGDAWDLNLWAPRIAETRFAGFGFKEDGTWSKSCDGKDDAVLSRVPAEKAKAILDGWAFLTPALVYRPHLLARDDSGVYYYIDKLAAMYGGKGYRVFVGKKGAMKPVALTDVASDSAGEVFSTKTGDLRLVHDDGEKATATWIKGEKRTALVGLNVDVNSPLIFRDLGIYTFLGTLCDTI